MESGTIIDEQESWMETYVNGPGRVTFWWKISSENLLDRMRFYVGGVDLDSTSGINTNWVQMTFDVPPGWQSLRWRYMKNGSVTQGEDQAWVDQIQYAPIFPPVYTLSNP